MLNKSARLSRSSFPKKKARIQHIFPWGTVSEYPGGPFKAAVVISKKTLKTAVDRNLARRRLYAAMKEEISSKESTFTVFPRTAVLKTSFSSLKQDLRTIL